MELVPLSEYREIINKEIESEVAAYAASLATSDELYKELITILQSFVSTGGKRLRAYLAYLAYVGNGGEDIDVITKIGVSVELLHSFLLIHDDIIDQDSIRYGKKNIFAQYQDTFNFLSLEDATRNAESVALLAGNIVHILSSKVLSELPLDTNRIHALLHCVQEQTLAVAEGELVDVLLPLTTHEELSLERVLSMYEKKTASYTIELPLTLGVTAARGDSPTHDAIRAFSNYIGIAFQLQDDVLGMFGDSEKTGKTNDGDIQQGKRTLLYMHAISTLSGGALQEFQSLYGKKNSTPVEIARVKELVGDDVRKSIEDQCEEYFAKAEALVGSLGLNQAAQSTLTELMNTIQCRTS